MLLVLLLLKMQILVDLENHLDLGGPVDQMVLGSLEGRPPLGLQKDLGILNSRPVGLVRLGNPVVRQSLGILLVYLDLDIPEDLDSPVVLVD
jgi:hypothetical protein